MPVEAVNAFSSRIVFFTLFVVAFIAWNLQRQLQESAEFTAQKESAEKTGLLDNIKVLFSNKIAVRTVIFLAVIYLTWNLVASVMGFFQPHIYETAGGVTNEQANWMNFIQWAIIVSITFVVSKLIDKSSHSLMTGTSVVSGAYVLVTIKPLEASPLYDTVYSAPSSAKVILLPDAVTGLSSLSSSTTL